MAMGRDPIGDPEIGNQAKHAGDLKSPHEEIERGPFVVRAVRFRHELALHRCFGDNLCQAPDLNAVRLVR